MIELQKIYIELCNAYDLNKLRKKCNSFDER